MVIQIILQGAAMVFGITIVGFLLSKALSRGKDE